MTKPLEQKFIDFWKNMAKESYEPTEEDIEMLKEVNKKVDEILYSSPKEMGGYAPTGGELVEVKEIISRNTVLSLIPQDELVMRNK